MRCRHEQNVSECMHWSFNTASVSETTFLRFENAKAGRAPQDAEVTVQPQSSRPERNGLVSVASSSVYYDLLHYINYIE